ncbi:FtsQ-type POTRA domain-containing protein [Simkania negevensis]|uniref:FtsQ-type POTRA domain-containing protein n=1 Tax=Simkania negevensis TaxID=83561 RepID=A0ABS3AR98_9BACT|nr:FtsQ-type POTRA domain-containing protein [Simkania negevensis]
MNRRRAKKERVVLPLSKALLYIFLSTACISGVVTLGWLYYLHIIGSRMKSDQYLITTLIQKASTKDSLAAPMLAELLELSYDNPTNIYLFDGDQAQKRLLASPVIAKAVVNEIYPNSVRVDYTLRTPVAYLYDWSNTALDENGVAFPVEPFYELQTLPEIILGLPHEKVEGYGEVPWGRVYGGEKGLLALELLKELRGRFDPKAARVKFVDVSRVDHEQYGTREIVVGLEESLRGVYQDDSLFLIVSRTLRLPVKEYKKAIENYVELKKHLDKKNRSTTIMVPENRSVRPSAETIIDLRIPEQAFTQETYN